MIRFRGYLINLDYVKYINEERCDMPEIGIDSCHLVIAYDVGYTRIYDCTLEDFINEMEKL